MSGRADDTIIQRSYPRVGKWVTEFLAQFGRSLVPLFTLVFREDPEATVIIEVEAPYGSSPLSPTESDSIRAAANCK